MIIKVCVECVETVAGSVELFHTPRHSSFI